MTDACTHGHLVQTLSRFRFDPDPGTRLEALLVERGLEDGVLVSIWYCHVCDVGRATFTDPDEEAPS